jgi:hypothetical protein
MYRMRYVSIFNEAVTGHSHFIANQQISFRRLPFASNELRNREWADFFANGVVIGKTGKISPVLNHLPNTAKDMNVELCARMVLPNFHQHIAGF